MIIDPILFTWNDVVKNIPFKNLLFRSKSYWFWVPIIGPHIGAIIGSILYDLLIGLHWPHNEVHSIDLKSINP